MTKIRVFRKTKNPLPKFESQGAAVVDLRYDLSLCDTEMIEKHYFTTEDGKNGLLIPAGGVVMLHTGLHVELPHGTWLALLPKSGLAGGLQLSLANTPSVIDEDFRGEIKIFLYNFSKESRFIEENQRICQAILMPYIPFNWVEVADLKLLSETERGSNGIGSTGVQ